MVATPVFILVLFDTTKSKFHKPITAISRTAFPLPINPSSMRRCVTGANIRRMISRCFSQNGAEARHALLTPGRPASRQYSEAYCSQLAISEGIGTGSIKALSRANTSPDQIGIFRHYPLSSGASAAETVFLREGI